MDADLKELMAAMLESQTAMHKSIGDLSLLIGKSHDALEASHVRLEAALEASNGRLEAAQLKTAEAVQAFVASGEARFKRLEENLDGLIRAITREHSNGKAH
jgi:hypothetical protein